LISAYYSEAPDQSVSTLRVAFGTSGHRASSFNNSFNENHILAITQAICIYRKQQHIEGPLFLGMDTHGLSVPAHITAIEVLAANGVEVMIAEKDEYTPTPVISHAILTYNNTLKSGLSDGIVITPSHNPPDDGGFKYNPPNGDPQKQKLSKLSPSMIQQKELAGEKITNILTNAPGNGASIGGLKVTSENGWFAARPSGTEDIYKIYAESYSGKEHLQKIIEEAQVIVDKALA
jgi:phosphoglucomutase